MNALAFVFRPAWLAAIHFGYVLALLLAVGGACTATRQWRPLAAIMVLAALAWPANVAASVWASLHASSHTPAGVLAWLPFVGYAPMWAAIVVGLVAGRRGRARAG